MAGDFLLPLLPTPLLWLATVVLGAVIGSFLNVVIHRLPLIMMKADDDESEPELSLAWPPSHCPRCIAPIRARHNIPLVGFILLRGRCADCSGAISWRYPVVEATSATVAAVVLWQFGPTPQAGLVAVLLWGLMCIAAIDLEHMLIPDELSGSLLWLGLTASALGVWPLPVSDSVLGGAFGYLSMWLLSLVAARLMNREAVGGGDSKLLAALGAWAGWQSLPTIFLGACLVGTVVMLPLIMVGRHHRQNPFAFGPFLALVGGAAILLRIPANNTTSHFSPNFADHWLHNLLHSIGFIS